ncbi:J domain-containing protein [Arthrobacter sp. I2-34]|uniref:J domain-containing protein n=1 Tax=Arthrobacter hankyongi TaxID=2904801 RepID=A0ABS9LDW3_9MICC|nr:J domain-containing protein [Arthrobacter hankyongi]MCG2624860.1 J domain-containing protein [Arthrobacter hankyongi]
MNSRLPDLYAVLRVDRTATPGQIRSAYRRLLRTLHPDLQPGSGDEEAAEVRRQLQAVMEAYEVLGDPERRAEYDRATAPSPLRSELQEPFLLDWPPQQGGTAGRPRVPDFPVLEVEALLEYFLRRQFPWWPHRGPGLD